MMGSRTQEISVGMTAFLHGNRILLEAMQFDLDAAKTSNKAMTEFAITFGITISLAFGGMVLLSIAAILVSWRQMQQDQMYWMIQGPRSCPHCKANYDVAGQDHCITRLVDIFPDNEPRLEIHDSPGLVEPFMGEREFRCSLCGTVAGYERKNGPAILQDVTRPEDVCYPRRCLECNYVFALPAYGKCPICNGDKLLLEADLGRS